MFLERVGGEEAGGEEAFAGLQVADCCALAGLFGMCDNCGYISCNSLSVRIEEISGSNSGSIVGSESIVAVWWWWWWWCVALDVPRSRCMGCLARTRDGCRQECNNFAIVCKS